MGQPVVHFELVGRDGTSLEGFLSYSEVFGCDAGPQGLNDAFTKLQDELPDDVAFYVSVERPVLRRSQTTCTGTSRGAGGHGAPDFELAVIP